MNIRHLETKNTKVSSQTINGFSVKAFLYANAFAEGDTTYGSSKLDFSKVSVKAILNRGGQDYILFQDNLKVIGLASNLNTRGQLAFYSEHDHLTKLDDGKALVSFNIHLGGHIHITGEDYVYVEVTNQNGLFDPAYINSSFLEMKALKSVGYETFIPSIKSLNIQAGTTSEVYSLGDNILRTVLLNYDKVDFTQPVLQNLNFASDRLNEGYTYYDIINMKDQSFPKMPVNLSTDEATILESDQSFTLTDFHQVFNGVVLSMQFDGTQVAASQNFIVYWSSKTSLAQLQKAAALEQKHNDAAISALPLKTA
jgi:hypothetical protein